MMPPDPMLPVPRKGPEGRIPPQAVEVEQAVLGAMLIDPDAIPRAIEIIEPGAFYTDRHNKIYQAVLSLFERTNPVDIITVTDELKRREELEAVGGAYYITELTAQVANAANVEYHARIIAEKSLLRQMITTLGDLIGKAYEPGSDAFELLDAAEGDIFRISESNLRRAATSMKDVLKDTLTRLESIHGREGGVTGVPSGFSKLDQMTSGWQKSDLIILAARPSMGKTAFSLSCARNAALHPKMPVGVAIFSLEMSAQQLAQRMLTSEARVDAQAARTGRLRDDDWPRMARAAGRLSEAPIFIDDTPGLSVLELRAKCRRLKAEHDIGLIIVDYLQLMHGTTTNKNANREQEIAHISRSLKALAKELDVPVIALSQLSRAVETRGGDKRPQLSDLRESGCLTGESLVAMADTGERIPIRELAGKSGFRVWAVDEPSGKLVKSVVSNAFSTGTKPVLKLRTKLGKTIRATGNHKFLTIEGWKRLDELGGGDLLAIPSIEFLQHATLLQLAGAASNDPDQPARLHRDVDWDQIQSIEPDGVEQVFDLTVPGPHNFVANDIVVHNSIEQDADIVGFIYRAERYGITVDENGNSTEGMAEIIIGKQRNGPIGDIRLAFVHQFARFENLNSYYQGVPGGGLPGDEPMGGDGSPGGAGYDEPPPF
ncbi:MAG: replicative DNA helicase [Rhodothermales bacterium]|nr:replicative DNA helicase [Rhodothermales bacterium]MBO6778809.1 replicative DNA helicase [Rhodothermales bacterium]